MGVEVREGMDKSEASQRLTSIFAIQHLEISHHLVLDNLPLYVDLEVCGCDAAKVLPSMWQFIQGSSHCRDIYECLRTLAQLEQAQQLPPPNFRDLFND